MDFGHASDRKLRVQNSPAIIRAVIQNDDGTQYDYEKGKYATIPLEWTENKQTLTIGNRSGTFPNLLKERTFHVVFVSARHGTGKGTEEKPDAVAYYTGKTLTTACKK
jgi:alpha-D-xyloside xylohydrolase